MTVMKLNHQSQKYSENINQSTLFCDVSKIIAVLICKQSLRQLLLTARHPTSRGIKNTITWKPLFRVFKVNFSQYVQLIRSHYLTTFQIPVVATYLYMFKKWNSKKVFLRS